MSTPPCSGGSAVTISLPSPQRHQGVDHHPQLGGRAYRHAEGGAPMILYSPSSTPPSYASPTCRLFITMSLHEMQWSGSRSILNRISSDINGPYAVCENLTPLQYWIKNITSCSTPQAKLRNLSLSDLTVDLCPSNDGMITWASFCCCWGAIAKKKGWMISSVLW